MTKFEILWCACVLVCSFEAYSSACRLTVELVVHLFRQIVEHVHIVSVYETRDQVMSYL